MKKILRKKSAFFNPRVLLAFVLCSIGLLMALFGLGAFPGSSAFAQDSKGRDATPSPKASQMQSGMSLYNDESMPLRDAPFRPFKGKGEDHEGNENPKIPHNHIDAVDTVVQDARISAAALASPLIPAPILNFDGIPFPGVACNCAPPDTNGAVGPTQYVQMVNEGFQIFNKSTGASILGLNSIASLFVGMPAPCNAGN